MRFLHPTAAATVAAVLLLLCGTAVAGARKPKVQSQPKLPELARRMGVKGTVRLEIEIAADGSVKSDKPLGGHPLLIQSAEQAVRKWRFEPGPPTKEVVEFNFQQTN